MKKVLLYTLATLAPLLPLQAAASCGAAFCSTNTDWDVHGAWTEPGLRADLRYESIRQDQPMTGSRRIGVGEIPKHHDEVYTKNRNWLATLDYAIDGNWALNASVPWVDREHFHIHNHGGGQLPERWDFAKLGDARIMARRRLASFEDGAPSIGTLGLNMGLKLPTGQTRVRNGDGSLAERTLQPGTGTTDLLAGLYYSKVLPMKDLSWFVQGLVQVPLNSKDDYRPGRRLSADAGLRYAVAEKTSLLLQANAQVRSRDAGAQAEPEDSGGRALYLSPGVSHALSPGVQVYGFIQLPVYQYVNGVQLTARRSVAVGISSRF